MITFSHRSGAKIKSEQFSEFGSRTIDGVQQKTLIIFWSVFGSFVSAKAHFEAKTMYLGLGNKSNEKQQKIIGICFQIQRPIVSVVS